MLIIDYGHGRDDDDDNAGGKIYIISFLRHATPIIAIVIILARTVAVHQFY
ncbi:MAG: hypothetical protein ACI90V_004889 [Bacillariaceae sp.]|jgi:hypothetical protein